MKSKTNFKILLVFGIIFVAFLLFNTTVEATTLVAEKANNDVEWVDSIAEAEQYENHPVRAFNTTTGAYEYKTFDYAISIRLALKNENLTLEEFKSMQKYLKDNNLTELVQKVNLYIPDDVTAVEDAETGEEYTIYGDTGAKYIEYDVKVSKIFDDVSNVINYYEEVSPYQAGQQKFLEYTTADGAKSVVVNGVVNEAIGLYSDFNMVYDTYIGDENGSTTIEKYKYSLGIEGVEGYATSRRYYVLRGGAPIGDNYPAQTTMSYLNDYIYFGIGKYKENSISVNFNNGSDINKTITFEYWKSQSENFHYYRAKITTELEDLLFSKPQVITLTYKVQDKDFELPHTMVSNIQVEGAIRTSVKLNDDEEVKINFDGVLPIGVSIKCDDIAEDTEIHATLRTTGINNLENQFNVKNLIYISISEIYTVGGDVDGAIKLTFNVGEQYNGKYVYILHKTQNGYEYFREKVENGKVSIVVYELSPFMVAVENQAETGTQSGETTTEPKKDSSPKMGVDNNALIIASVLTVISLGAIVFIKRMK